MRNSNVFTKCYFQIIRKWNIGGSTVSDIRRDREKIIAACLAGHASMCTLHAVKNAQAENAVNEYFALAPEQRGSVSRKLVQHIARNAQGPSDDYGTPFEASDHWFRRYCTRHEITRRKPQGTRARQNRPASIEYSEYIVSFLKDIGISLNAVFNADETHASFRPQVSHTYVKQGEVVPESRGVEKNGMSLLTGANATGLKPSLHVTPLLNCHNTMAIILLNIPFSSDLINYFHRRLQITSPLHWQG